MPWQRPWEGAFRLDQRAHDITSDPTVFGGSRRRGCGSIRSLTPPGTAVPVPPPPTPEKDDMDDEIPW